jgi:hypothetical protein
MQGIPALLATLHHLSVGDDAGDYSSKLAADRDRADREREERQRLTQQEIDECATVRARQALQAQKNRQESERRRAMQAAATAARQEFLERAQADRAKRGPASTAPADAGPTAGPSDAAAVQSVSQDPPNVTYNFPMCRTETSSRIEAMILNWESEVRDIQQKQRKLEASTAEIQQQQRNFEARTAELTIRLPRLKQDLATKQQEEALKR